MSVSVRMVSILFLCVFLAVAMSLPLEAVEGTACPKAPKTFRGIVCIDPGHPSETSAGTRAKDGTTENDVNWLMANLLADQLRALNFSVILTKNKRLEHVTNQRRAEIANEAGAHLLFRLHCDAGKKGGFTLYYPDRPGTKKGVTGPSLAICKASGEAARAIREGMKPHMKGFFADNGIRTDSQTYVGQKQGALTGSIYTKVPAVTIEMFYMSSEKDMKTYHSPAGRAALLKAMVAGICAYLP